LKNLPDTGHEEDQAKNKPGEKQSPAALPFNAHYLPGHLGQAH
jgi:hypothetical protein